MSDLEDPLIPGEQPDMAQNTALSKVTIASRILSILSAVFAICSATAQQLVSGDKPVFWSNVIILVCTSILLIANLTLFWKQATIRGAVFDWPKKGAWWPVTRGTYPKTAYLGTPYEFLGVAFGICQLTTTTGTLVLHHWKMGPIRFSLIPLAIAAIGVVRGFYPGAFEPVFEVVMRCRGEIHRFTGHASGMSIDGDCNSHPEEMEGEQNDDGMEGGQNDDGMEGEQNDDGMEGQNDDDMEEVGDPMGDNIQNP